MNYQSSQENVDSSKNAQVTQRVTRSQTRAKQDTAIDSKARRAAITMAGNTFQQAGTKAAASSSSSSRKGGKQTANNKKATATTGQKSAATKKGGSTFAAGAGDGPVDEDERGD